MNELIKITTDQSGQRVVSARDLHAFLEVSSNPTTWFYNQAERCMLDAGKDFIQTSEESTGGRPSIDFAITLSSAKEISMMNGGEKGKQARLYFIEMEKQAISKVELPKVPATLLEALKAMVVYEEEKLVMQYELQEAKPKVEFFDQVAGAKDAISIGDAAKTLNIEGIGRNKLFEILRDKAILMHDNKPYQKYIDLGWFRVVEQVYSRPDSETYINIKTLVYQKGLQGIAKIISKA